MRTFIIFLAFLFPLVASADHAPMLVYRINTAKHGQVVSYSAEDACTRWVEFYSIEKGRGFHFLSVHGEYPDAVDCVIQSDDDKNSSSHRLGVHLECSLAGGTLVNGMCPGDLPEPPKKCVNGDPGSAYEYRGMSTGIDWSSGNSAPDSLCDGSCVINTLKLVDCFTDHSSTGNLNDYPAPAYCFFTGYKTGDTCSPSPDDPNNPDNPNKPNNPNSNDPNNPNSNDPNSNDPNNPNSNDPNSNDPNNPNSNDPNTPSTPGGGGSGNDNGDGNDDEGDNRTAGGGCQNFTCSGDAIDCSIAKAAWEQRCVNEWAEKDNDFSNAWNTAKNQEGGDTSIIKEDKTDDWFKLNNYISAPSACPADISFTVFGKTITAPLSWLCAYLSIIALILKTLAWLFVGHKVLGAF